MEEKKEKKTIKCSYAVLTIILFATVAFLTDYIIIEEKTRKCNIIDLVSNEEKNKFNYDDIAGLYVYKDDEHIKLYLYTDGTYYFQTSVRYARGSVGNYLIKDDQIILNSIAEHGSDIARFIKFESKNITVKDENIIIDENPSYFTNDSEFESIKQVLLEKVESYNDQNNTNSMFKNILNNGEIYNEFSKNIE